MSVYPTIPIVQFYGNPVDTDSLAKKIELGKGSVIDRFQPNAINKTRKSYKITATIQNRDELKAFLETNRGLPFEFRFDGANRPELFICKTYTFEWIVYVAGSGGVWKFTGTFEQVYRPDYSPITSGAATLQIPQITLSGTGLIAQSDPTGSGTLNLPVITVSSSGTVNGDRIGTGDLSIPGLTTTSNGFIIHLGSGTISLPAISTTGSGTAGPDVFITDGTLELTAIEVSGTGSITNVGSGALSLPAIAVSGTGTGGSNLWDFDEITTAGWWDISDTSTLFNAITGGSTPPADSAIARIEDKSGNGRHWKQSTSGNRGIRKTSEINSLDILRLDGTDDGYVLDNDLSLTSHSIFMVFKPSSAITSSSTGTCLLSGGTGTLSTAELILFTGSVTGNLTDERLSHIILQDGGVGLQVYGYAQNDTDISGANQFSLVWDNTGQSFAGDYNGDSSFAATSTVGGFTNSRKPNAIRFLGYRGSTSSAYSAIDLCELVVVSSALSVSDRQKAQGRLAHKWGLTSLLAAAHPYKTNPPTV